MIAQTVFLVPFVLACFHATLTQAYLNPANLLASYFTPEAFSKANATGGVSVHEDQSGNNRNIDVAPSNMIIEDDYVTFNHNGGVAVNSFRDFQWGKEIGIIFWFRRAPPGSEESQGIIGNADDSEKGSWSCFISGKDSYHERATFGVEIDVIDVENGKRTPESFDGLDIEVDKWHMVVFTKSENFLNFYLDAVKITFNGVFDWPAHGEIFSDDKPLMIGGKQYQGHPFIGDMKDVYIYDQFIGRDDVCLLYGCETLYPTPVPTPYPPKQPTPEPSIYVEPTPLPSYAPTKAPTQPPTPLPTFNPTHPEGHPSPEPTKAPTAAPSKTPTAIPTRPPTEYPTTVTPTTATPTTAAPTAGHPSPNPTHEPYVPTPGPTEPPTPNPTTVAPTLAPTLSPTKTIVSAPTPNPTANPTQGPTSTPSSVPTPKPTVRTSSGGGFTSRNSGMGQGGKIGLGLGLAFVALLCLGFGYYYRKRIGEYVGGDSESTVKEVKAPAAPDPVQKAAGIKSRNKDDDSDEEEVMESVPEDAYERWMAVVESGAVDKKNIQGVYNTSGDTSDTMNPLHALEAGKKLSITGANRGMSIRGGSVTGNGGDDLIIGSVDEARLSSVDDVEAGSYDGYIVDDRVRRLSQEVGRSESAHETLVREKRTSSASGKAPTFSLDDDDDAAAAAAGGGGGGAAVDGSKSAREKALLKHALASQGGAQRRPSALSATIGSAAGGRGARRTSLLSRGQMRRPTPTYQPPTAAKRGSAIAEDAAVPATGANTVKVSGGATQEDMSL
jgi:hypothetical protein